jgi:hypothetical protein
LLRLFRLALVLLDLLDVALLPRFPSPAQLLVLVEEPLLQAFLHSLVLLVPLGLLVLLDEAAVSYHLHLF